MASVSRFWELWIRKTMRKVTMVVAVLMTSCQVSLKPKRGPVMIQTTIDSAANVKTLGRPLNLEAALANWLYHCASCMRQVWPSRAFVPPCALPGREIVSESFGSSVGRPCLRVSPTARGSGLRGFLVLRPFAAEDHLLDPGFRLSRLLLVEAGHLGLDAVRGRAAAQLDHPLDDGVPVRILRRGTRGLSATQSTRPAACE